MKKSLIAMTAAGALAVAAVSVPTRAEALPVWVVPVIVGAAVGGVVLGGAVSASANSPYYGGPRGNVYVQPTTCHIERRPVNGYWRRVEVCP